jgi:3-methylfumaryl-CoA hydratase
MAAANGNLARYVEDWSPSVVETRDISSPQRVREMATTLDLDHDVAEGDPLPPLWQWAFFLDWIPTSALGSDGYPHDVPPLPSRRRMFAGGRTTGRAGLYSLPPPLIGLFLFA